MTERHFTLEIIELLEGAATVISETLLRKQKEKRLEFIKRSIDAAPDSAFWMDLEGKFIHINESGCQALGYGCGELLKMSLFDIVSDTTGGRLSEVREILRSDKKFVTETVFRRRNGTEFPVEIIVNRVVYDGQKYLSGFAQDITHRKMAEQRLQDLLHGKIDNYTVEKAYLHKDGHPVWVGLTTSGVRNDAGELGWFVTVVKDITERIQIEKALKKNTARLAEAEEIGGCGSWSWEIESDHIEWSHGLYRLMGIDPREDPSPYYSGHSSLYTLESWKILNEGVQRAIQHGEDYELELNAKRTDGRVIDVLIRGFPIRNDAGQVVRLQGSVLDITRHNFMQKQLRDSEQVARSLLNATHDITHLMDEDGIINDINNAMVDVLGGSREDLIGTCIFDRFAEESAEYRKGIMRRALREQKPVKCTDATSPSGKIYSTTVYPIEALAGGKRQVVVFSHDVTDLEKARNALEYSESRLKEAQRIAHIGSCELDLLTDTFTGSDEIYRIFETGPEKLGKYEALLDTFHPDERDAVDAAYRHTLETREPFSIDHRLIMPDGRIKYVHAQCHTFYSPDGKPLRSVGTVQDITDLKKAEIDRIQMRNELAHLSRVMSMNELAGSLAHEINQPLGAIMNNASALRKMYIKSGKKNTEIEAVLDDIITGASRAGEIIHKIRGLMGKEAPKFEKLDLNVLIKDVLALYRNTFIIEKISVSLALQPDLLPIRGDRIQLQQVLINLMTNAAEAMKKSPSRNLSIHSAMRSSDTITVSVSDSGPGVDEETKNKIFQPFFTTKRDGLGMGLRICRSIVKDHGGRIWVADSSAGGATFSFSLKTFQENAI